MTRLTLILTLACIIVIGANCAIRSANEPDRIAARGYAQAQMTLASAESARANADASATRTAAALPMVAMAMTVFLGLIALALPVTLFVLYYLHNQHTNHAPQQRIVVQRTVLLLPSGTMSRADMYRLLGGNANVKHLEGPYENA